MNTLTTTLYFTLRHDVDRGVVWLVRTPERLETEHVDGVLDTMIPAVRAAGADPARLRVLIDLRQGPAKNDPVFEAKMNTQMRAFVTQFHRFAVLVRSAVGALQVTRLVRPYGDHLDDGIFRDEAEALAYLTAA